MDQILSIWLTASKQRHSFVPSAFWDSQIDIMRDVYIPASETYVWDEGGQVLGFYSLHGNVLAAIFVNPDFQGAGIGTKLINHAKEQRNELILSVYDKNVEGYQFYLSRGFLFDKGRVDDLTGESESILYFRKS